MMAVLSGVNEGQAIVFGCGEPWGGKLVGVAGGAGLGVQATDVLAGLVVVSVSFRSTWRFEKTDVPSKSISENGRVCGAMSPSMNATCLPSGENAGVWATFTSCVREGEATAAPVVVFTKLDGYMPENPCGRLGGPSPGLPFVSASVPSGVNAAKANCWPGPAGLRGVGVGEATVRVTVSLDVGLLRSGPRAAEST